MPLSLTLPIALRLASSLVFIIAVIVAGSLHRSVVMVPLLAGVATLVHWGASRMAPGPLSPLQGLSGPDPRPRTGSLVGARLLGGTLGYGIIFMITVFFSALFHETQLERALTRTDGAILLVATAIAAPLALYNAVSAARRSEAISSTLEGLFSQARSRADDESAFTVEGEVIDTDKPDS